MLLKTCIIFSPPAKYTFLGSSLWTSGKRTNFCKITEDLRTESVQFAHICYLKFSKARENFRVDLFSWLEKHDKIKRTIF